MERIGLVPGTEIGGYRVIGPLGQGGMGAVYRAVDGDGRTVALKLLHPHLGADPAARERLRREVAHLQRLRHPAVARVLDAEIEADDAFVVTELVEGQDLVGRVRSLGPVDAAGLVELGERLREALEVVHAAGVLHRDLTPGNVLLSPRGPVLIDFGIAQAAEDARVTSTGMVVGTPGYLSPELLEGEDPTVAADWWGWAAVLAFAATGRAPFGTRPVQAVLARVRSGEADLAGLDPRTTVAIRSALAVDPRRRATPAEVLAELRRAAHGDVEVDGTGATQVLAGGATRVLPSGPPRRTPQDADSTAVLDTVDATPTQQAPGWYRADEQEDDRTAVLERDSDPYDAYPPAYEDDEPYDTAYDDPDIPAPYLAPVPARRTGTVAAVGAALVALAATRPGVALTVAVALAVLARGVGVAVGGVHARRARRGERSGDVPWAVVGAPWYLLRGVLGVLPAALVAASAVVVLGGVAWWLLGSGRYVLAEPAPGTSAGQLPGNAAWVVPAVLAVIGLLGLVTLWFGPMMRPTRLGARWTLQAVAPGQAGAVVVVVVALALAAVLAYSAVQGAPPVWWPLPGPPQIG